MPLTWRGKRQLFYYSIFAVFVFILIVGFIFYFKPAPTCFDGKQNQGEGGVDCGGPCEKGCLGQVSNPTVLWTRFFKTGDTTYDIAALIDNPNIFAGSGEFHYRLKLHDKDNILIAIRDGVTFINPQERFVIFESEVQTARRIPVSASIELDQVDWQRIEMAKPLVEAYGYKFTTHPYGIFDVTLRNGDIFPVKNIEVVVVLFDDSRNASGVSRTKIDLIEGESERKVGFSWPVAFDRIPASVEVYIRKIP